MRVILFDFDGVIVDTFSMCYRIIHARVPLTRDEYRAKFDGNINDASKPVSQTIHRHDFMDEYLSALLPYRPDRDMVQAILELARDHALIIISSTVTPAIDEYLKRYGLRDAFKEILGNDVEPSKIKKIQDVLKRYKIKPSETVFITDTLGDIREAQACGVPSLAVTWGYQAAETLQQGSPSRLIGHPKEIVAAIKSMGV